MPLLEQLFPNLPLPTLGAAYAGGVVLLLLELVVPGVVVGVLGGGVMTWALLCGYRHDHWIFSSVLLGLSIALIPKIIVAGINRMALKGALTDERGYRAVGEADERLIGREGTAHTVLRPSGIVMIDGRRLDALAETGMIDQGRTVRVLRTQGYQVVVREA